ncbi:MAG: hypothetical protein ABI867_33915 [Kofleriaceae bacterium]
MVVRVRAWLLVAAAIVPRAALAQPDSSPDSPPAPTPAPTPAPRTVAKEHGTPAYKPPAFTWEPFGFLRLQYSFVQNDPNIAFVGRDDGFQLQNARVGMRGRLDRRAAFVVSFDGAVDEREQINVPEGKLGVGLRDAFVDVALGDGLPWDAASPKLVARAGFFQTWIDPEGLVPDTSRELVDRPLESRGIRATEGFQTQGLTPGRSLGAALRIEPPVQPFGIGGGLELAVQNGADEFASNNDNDKPAVSAAGLVRTRNGSFVVGGVRYNPRTAGDLPFRRDEDDLQATAGLRVVAGPVAFGGAFVVVHTTFPTTGGPSQNAVGGHGQLMVTTGDVTFGYRFAILDPSSLITTDRVMEHTVGAVLAVPRYRMRFQAQLVYTAEQGERELSNSRAQLAAEVAL